MRLSKKNLTPTEVCPINDRTTLGKEALAAKAAVNS